MSSQGQSKLITDIIIKKISQKQQTSSELKLEPEKSEIKSNFDHIMQTVQEQKIQPKSLTQRQCQVAQKMILGWKARKLYRGLRKNCKLRRKAIEQIIDTEKDYRQDLQIIDKYVRQPLIEGKSEEDDRMLFPNFVQIKSLSDELLYQLVPRFSKYNFHQIFGDILKKKAPYFAIYIEFMSAHKKVWIPMQDPRILQVMSRFQQSSNLNNTCIDYIAKPFQRLTKYASLIRPILEKTPTQHPDFTQLEQAFKGFLKVVDKVNDLMQNITMNKRIQDLDREFSTQKFQILDNNRRLLFQEQVYWIHQGRILVNAYFFNDMIIFINQQGAQKKIIKTLPWSSNSSLLSLQDGKTITNAINISCADQSVTLECGKGSKGSNKKQALIQNINSKMLHKQEQRVIVKALGTQQLNSISLSMHTIYIMQVNIGPFRQNLFIRFKQLLQIITELQRYYKHLNLPTLQKKWLTNHKSSIIEERKVQILQILQTIINDREVQKDPQFMIQKLKLRQNFYQLPKKIEQEKKMRQKILQDSSNKKITPFEILCTTQLRLGRYNFHGNQIYRDSLKSGNYFIDIKLMTGQFYKIKISQLDTVEDVCNKVSSRVGLLMNRDFRLFHEIGKKQSRALDHDRMVIKIFDLKQEKQEGFLMKISKSIKNIIVPDTKPVLTFKKYFYLPIKYQQLQYKRDLTRLKLLAYQILFEVKDMKYHLTLDEYCFFAATYLYITNQGEVEKQLKNNSFNIPQLQQAMIPELIFKCQNISQEQWKQKIIRPLKRLDEEIVATKKYNQNNISKIKKDVKLKLHTDKTCLCYQIIMNKIKSNFLFGSNLFYIQPHESLSKVLLDVQLSHNMWLAIKLQGISLLKPSNKEPVFQIQYNSLNQKIVHPSAIILAMYNQDKYRLITCQSFQISQLIDFLKKLNEVIEMVKNKQFSREDVVNASFYMNSLIKYRDSCK